MSVNYRQKNALNRSLVFVWLLFGAASFATYADDALPGAKYTAKAKGKKAFSAPVKGLGVDAKLDFQLGKAMFQRLWVTPPASTQAADGLGPLYNARACEGCHVRNGRGRVPKPGEAPRSLVMRLSVPAAAGVKEKFKPEPRYGSQLQTFAMPGIEAEGSFEITYSDRSVSLVDGTEYKLRVPQYKLTKLAYGDLASDAMTSPRLAPPVIGLGLLEMIPESALLANEDIHDADNDGISGKANRVISRITGKQAIGRFGWKAGIATVDEQNQDAAFHDIGLSTHLFPGGSGECTQVQEKCLHAPSGDSPQYDDLELPQKMTNLLRHYVMNISVPRRLNADNEQVQKGRTLFDEIGCASCHVPSHQMANKNIIWPYTDLLLHDMGEGLADNRPEGDANGREWRTPPLWGIAYTGVVNGNTNYLHDGRARSIAEAILWHAGEAQASNEAFSVLDKQQREQLLSFVKSL